jgi:putative acetyltransferase
MRTDMQSSAIRRASADDIATIARLFRAVQQADLPYLPQLHTPEEDLWFFRHRVFAECEAWVAGSPDAFIAFREGFVDHLYVRGTHQRRGLGTALLAQAMRTHSPLRLWAFQKNAVAIRFYAARGFREIERTDGSRNEEREPDILFEWRRADARRRASPPATRGG